MNVVENSFSVYSFIFCFRDCLSCFNNFYRATLCVSAVLVVSRCLSVRLSVYRARVLYRRG